MVGVVRREGFIYILKHVVHLVEAEATTLTEGGGVIGHRFAFVDTTLHVALAEAPPASGRVLVVGLREATSTGSCWGRLLLFQFTGDLTYGFVCVMISDVTYREFSDSKPLSKHVS